MCCLGLMLLGTLAAAQEIAPAAATPGRPNYCGVWGIWGGEKVSTEGRPWFKGVVVTTNWDNVEPEPMKFDWSDLDEKVKNVTDKGLSVMLLVYHGNKVPKWIFKEGGVPRVLTGGKRDSRQYAHPYYLDPAYKPLLSRLINETVKHVKAYPPAVLAKIVGVQCPTGKSGDPQPYMGPPLDPKFEIDPHGKPWIEWTIGMFQVYQEVWRDFKPPFFMLFKGPEPETNKWLIEHAPGSWRKPHAVAQGYSMNNEMDYAMDIYPYTHGDRPGQLVHTRGELDNTEGKAKNWFNAAPVWNVYWTGLWVLNWGIDIWNQLPGVLQDPRHAPALEFASRYAGYKHPADAPGAWVALRDSLDIADVKRFPEDRFGKYDGGPPGRMGKNPERYQKIAAAMAAYGARLDDPEHVATAALNTRHEMTGLNDVGCHIWPGNYQMFMSQVAPEETSQGYWRVGPMDERFGRYARGFDRAAGKDAMYFQLAKGFFPAGASGPVRVRVVYFDRGKGAWALKYDAAGEPNKTALTVSKTDSGHWKEATVEIADGRFARSGPRQADLWLASVDGEDDIFHMVELERLKR